MDQGDPAGPPTDERVPAAGTEATTVGTGTALGLGCLALVFLLVLAALVYRRLAGM